MPWIPCVLEIEPPGPLAVADADAPLPLTLVEADGLAPGDAVEGLGTVFGVPPPAAVPVPATEPGEPALPLIRPLAFGARFTSVLPGAVITEPPTEVPGELLVMLAEVPPATWAAAC